MKNQINSRMDAFEKLLNICNNHGEQYNPTTESLKLANMTALLVSAKQSVAAVNRLHAQYGEAVYERIAAFEALPKFMTRLLSTLRSIKASPAVIAEVSRYKRRFAKKRTEATEKRADITGASQQGDPPPADRTSTQLSFSDQLSNFETIIKIVVNNSSYKTNEASLKPEALQQYLDTLTRKNQAVFDAHMAVTAARQVRDKLFYHEHGIVETGRAVKNHFKGAFGTTSPESRQLNKLNFRSNV